MMRTWCSIPALHLALGRVSYHRFDCNRLGQWELRQAQRLDPHAHMMVQGNTLVINTGVNPWR